MLLVLAAQGGQSEVWVGRMHDTGARVVVKRQRSVADHDAGAAAHRRAQWAASVQALARVQGCPFVYSMCVELL